MRLTRVTIASPTSVYWIRSKEKSSAPRSDAVHRALRPPHLGPISTMAAVKCATSAAYEARGSEARTKPQPAAKETKRNISTPSRSTSRPSAQGGSASAVVAGSAAGVVALSVAGIGAPYTAMSSRAAA
eukprot:scaffold5773_cov116-Isochrysis_galbana.AAC.7